MLLAWVCWSFQQLAVGICLRCNTLGASRSAQSNSCHVVEWSGNACTVLVEHPVASLAYPGICKSWMRVEFSVMSWQAPTMSAFGQFD